MKRIIPCLVAIILVLPAVADTSGQSPVAPARAPRPALPPAPQTPLPAPGELSVHDHGAILTIQYGGKSGEVGIPSWKAVLKRDDGGNISALHVPADSPRPLGARTDYWPLAVLATDNKKGVVGTWSDGREIYSWFAVPTFRLREKEAQKIVVEMGGPSEHKHYEHRRTYTFTPAGIQIEGEITALIDLDDISLASVWDRRQIADSHLADLPVRTQGRVTWAYMTSTGRDAAQALPDSAGAFVAKYPLEAELRLRRPTPTFVRIFFDQNFESAAGQRLLVHTNKDHVFRDGRKSFEKLVFMPGGSVAKGATQTYKMRFEFETQEWP